MTNDELRTQAWDYFALQAGQRLTTFNYYVLFSTAVIGGIGVVFKEHLSPGFVLPLCLLLALFSFIFWKLDQRSAELIKSAEKTLIYFESLSGLPDQNGKPHIAKRFTREAFDTGLKRSDLSACFWCRHYGYSDCFRLVYLCFGVIGALGVVWLVTF
jgi:hypothetical protein